MTLLFHGHFSNGQDNKIDSATYWVNQKYVDCIDKGNSVCSCQEQNNYLILHIDTLLNKLTIDPSIYYSREIIEVSIKKDKQNSYLITAVDGKDTASILKFTDNSITIQSLKELSVFKKIRVKRLDNWTQGDMWRQVGIINCRSLLKYNVTACNKTTGLVLTQKDLANYILQGQVSISCSDDYYYNEMYIRNSTSQFFLLYEENAIKIYKEPLRDKGQIVEVSKLKDCQIYIKFE